MKHIKLFEQFINEAYGPKEYSGFRNSSAALNWLKTNREIIHNGWIIKGKPKKDEIHFYAKEGPKSAKGFAAPFDEDELEDLIDELTQKE